MAFWLDSEAEVIGDHATLEAISSGCLKFGEEEINDKNVIWGL